MYTAFIASVRGEKGRGQGFWYICLLMLADLSLSAHSPISRPSTYTSFPPDLLHLKDAEIWLLKKGVSILSLNAIIRAL